VKLPGKSAEQAAAAIEAACVLMTYFVAVRLIVAFIRVPWAIAPNPSAGRVYAEHLFKRNRGSFYMSPGMFTS
jgi:hypothetical protein